MRLETARLRLRELASEDWLAVLAYQSDARYLRYYPWATRTAADVRQFLQDLIYLNHEQPRCKYHFAVVLRSSDSLIGMASLRQAIPSAWEADIGYELAPAYWRQGYATEAARELLRFGFADLHLHRISASCIADNLASARVLKKVGMRQEGCLRENEWFKDRWWDTLLYAILEREWSAAREPAGEAPGAA